MKYDNFLKLPELDIKELQKECLDYVMSKPRILNRKESVNFIEMDKEDDINKMFPCLAKTFAPLKLTPRKVVFFVMYNQEECGIHTDVWPRNARINIPLMNCENTKLEYYRGLTMKTVLNANNKKIQLIDSGFPILENCVTIDSATVVAVNIPHKVVMAKSPRITATIDFFEDAYELLKVRQTPISIPEFKDVSKLDLSTCNFASTLTIQKDLPALTTVFEKYGLEVNSILGFRFKPNEVQNVHVDGSLDFIRKASVNLVVDNGNNKVSWYTGNKSNTIDSDMPYISLDSEFCYRTESLCRLCVFDTSIPHNLQSSDTETKILSFRLKGNPSFEELSSIFTSHQLV